MADVQREEGMAAPRHARVISDSVPTIEDVPATEALPADDLLTEDEGPVEAQAVHSSRKYTFLPDAGKARRTRHSRRHHHRHHHHRSASKRRSVVPLVVALLVLLALAAAGFFAVTRLRSSARAVKATASSLMQDMGTVTDAVSARDADALAQAVASASEKAHGIQDEVHTSLWKLVALVPVYGSDLRSVQALSDVAVDLTDNALAPIAENSAVMELGNVFSAGTVNVAALSAFSESVETALPVVTRAAETIDALPDAHLSQVADVLVKAREGLDTAEGLLSGVQEVLPVLPAMFGADGQTRNYVVVAQNNAEIRSAGGFPGSFGLVRVSDGHIELDGFTSDGEFRRAVNSAGLRADISEEERTAFGSVFTTDELAVTFTPEFSRCGEMVADYWENALGDHIHGVVGMDPVFLQQLLALAGSVTASDGTVVDGTNCAEQLLSEVYWRYEKNTDQDAFFVEVGDLAMNQVMDHLGDTSIQDLVRTLEEAAESRHLQIWMEAPEEQAVMESLGVSGALGTDPMAPVIGTYANDNTWSKIDWYLKLETTLSEPHDNGDGTVSYDVVTTLYNTLPAEGLEDYPTYVTGSNRLHRTRGDMITTMYFFAPAGGHISDVYCPYDERGSVPYSGVGNDDFMGTVYDHEYWCCAVCTYPSDSETFSYRITVPAGAATPTVVTSPLPRIID